MGLLQPRLAEAGGAGQPVCRGGPEGTRTSYFYGSGFYPFGRSWGGIFAPTELCPIPEPEPPALCGILFLPPCPSDVAAERPARQRQDAQALTHAAAVRGA